MSSPWWEHEEAHEEVRAAALWYEEQSEGLGQRFTDAVETAVASVLDSSVSWGYYRGRRGSPQFHTRSVPGFPFDVIDGVIYVLAYAHERRRPGYWMNRVDS